MKTITSGLLALALAGAATLGACDKSRQSADGSTAPGDAGVAATGNGAVASTGSPEMNGANGTGPAQVPANATINAQDRATPESQSPGKANAARSP